MKKTIEIEGMTCMHCANRVETALNKLESILKVKVNLKKNQAVIKLIDEVDNELIIETINEIGYKVTQIL